ncbi:MAG TPA: xanthine dehydrogenase family protein subunit M [Vicinamibacteria bacterium]|nr:xanthine dehydrogenase family protein subunit M [Vicinamibacteria bacterium]
MRGDPRSMELLRPRSAAAAVRMKADHPRAVPLAGGTDFMVAWNAGHLNHRTVLDLSGLEDWKRIRELPGGLWIGALATHATIGEHPVARRRLPLLVQSCAVIGGVAIQNRGTLGGNLANASPAGDTFPPLAVYDAVVHVVSGDGRRTLPVREFFAGVKRTRLDPGELIEAVEVPFLERGPNRHLFRKVGTRAAQALSKTVAAGLLWRGRDRCVSELRFALGSMAPTVRRLAQVEAFVTGKRMTPEMLEEACALLERDVSPIDDFRSTAEYRLHISRNLLRSFLEERP